MAKALKVAATVVGVAALAVVTGGAALGLGVSLATTAFGVSAGALALASAGLSAASGLLTKAPTVPSSQAQRLIASIDPRAFRKTVLGQTAMATDIRYEEWSGKDQEYCDWIVCLASHAIDGVEEIWIDQELAWSASRGVSAKFAGYFSVPNIVLEGSAANAFTFATGKWNGSTRLTGCAYLRLRFKTTGNSKKATSPFSSQISTRLTIIGRGAKLYDPRRDSTVPGGSGPMRWNDQSTWRYTADDGAVIGENLALQILRVVLGWRICNPITGEWKLATGSGVPGRRIGMPSFQIAANLCDELVNRSAGGQEPRYHGAGVISEGDEPKTVLDMLCAACCGRFRDTGGKLELAIAHNDLAAVAADDGLNDDDVVGPFTWDPDPSLETTPNVIRGRYVDATAASLYQLVDFSEVRIPSPDGQDRIMTVDLGVVESPSQAQRITRQVLQRMQYKRTFSAPFDIRAWKYGVGDVLPFTFAPLGFERAVFRVADQEQGQGGTCQMTLSVEHQSIYAWDANDASPVMAADPIIYDRGNNPLILAIDEASQTAIWSGVADDNGKRPDDGATVGAPAGTPVGDRPAEQLLVQVDQAKADISDLIETYGNTDSSAQSAARAAAARDAAAEHEANAQTASGISDQARAAAQTARDLAQTAAGTATTQRGLAETARGGAETARDAATSAKAGSEAAKTDAQAALSSANTARDTAVAKATEAGLGANASLASAVVASSSARDAAGAALTGNRSPGASPSTWSYNQHSTYAPTNRLPSAPGVAPFGFNSAGNLVIGAAVVHVHPVGVTPIQPGRRYVARARWRLAEDGAQSGAHSLYAYFWDANGTYISGIQLASLASTTVAAGWQEQTRVIAEAAGSGAYVRPANAAFVRVMFRTSGTPEEIGLLYVEDVEAQMASDSSANAAATSASAASTSAGAAGVSASAAKVSETNAGTSAGAAKVSETNAASSRDTAANSAASATTSAGVAASSATSARLSTIAGFPEAISGDLVSISSVAGPSAGLVPLAISRPAWIGDSGTSVTPDKGVYGLLLINPLLLTAGEIYEAVMDVENVSTVASIARFYYTGLNEQLERDTNGDVTSGAWTTLQPGERVTIRRKFGQGVTPSADVTVIPVAAKAMRLQPQINRTGGGSTEPNAQTKLRKLYIRNVTSELGAKDAANAASTSAASASTSAGTAGQKAEAANTSANTASTKAGEASTSASRAAASESNAQGSASTAQTQAGLATTARNQADGFASAAQGSASTATAKATEAGQKATAASGSADTASTKAGEALSSAGRAATSESNAAGSATSAASSASVSATARDAAMSAAIVTMPDVITADTRSPSSGIAGAPDTRVSLPADRVANGVYNHPAGSSGVVVFKGVVPWELGKIYEVTVEVAVADSALAAPNAAGYARTLDANYSGIAASSERYVFFPTPPGQTTRRVTRFGMGVLPSSQGGTIAVSLLAAAPECAFVRFGALLNYSSTGNQSSLKVLTVRDVTALVAAQTSASAAATSESNAATSKTGADVAASAAATAKTQAETASGQAKTFSDSASVSASNAKGSENAAATSAGVSASSALAAVLVSNNPHFDQGVAGWASSAGGAASSTEAPANTWTPRADYPGAGTALVATSRRADLVSFKKTSVTAGRLYKASIRLEHVVPDGVTSRTYVGIQTLDANGAPIGTNNGYNYLVLSNRLYGNGWQEAAAVFSTTSLTAGTASVRLLAFTNYNGAAGVTVALDYLMIEDVTDSEASKAAATAASTSASTATTKASEAGTAANTATTAKNSAETAKGQAETAASAAASSASNAKGSENSASSSASLSSRSAADASSYAARNLVAKGTFTDGSAGLWTGAAAYFADGSNGGTIRLTNRDAWEDVTRPIAEGRRLRVTATGRAPGSYGLMVGVQVFNAAGNTVNWPRILIAAAGTTAMQTVTADIVLPAGTMSYRGFASSEGPGGASGHDARIKSIFIEDVTDSYAAQASASAALTSATTAGTKASDAGQNAATASTERQSAQTASGEAKSYRDAAAASASGAAGSASTATQQAGIAADYATGNRSDSAKSYAKAASDAQVLASQNAAAAQTSATLSAQYGVRGGNLVPNTEWLNNRQGWNSYAEGGGTVHEVGINYQGGWTPSGQNTFFARQQGRVGGGSTPIWTLYSANIPLSADQWYQFYADLAAHRCDTEVFIEFFNGNNQVIGGQNVWSGRTTTLDGGNLPSNYSRVGRLSFKAPGGTAFARLHIRKFDTWEGRSDSFLFVWRAYVGAAREGQNEWNAFTAGPNADVVAGQIASVEQIAGAVSDMQGRTRAYLQNTVQAGSAVARVSMYAESAPGVRASAIELAADAVYVGANRALEIHNGLVRLNGRVSASNVDLDNGGHLSFTSGNGSYRLVQGAAVGPQGNMVLWYGPSSVARGSETIQNSRFAFGTDGLIYLGSTVLTTDKSTQTTLALGGQTLSVGWRSQAITKRLAPGQSVSFEMQINLRTNNGQNSTVDPYVQVFPSGTTNFAAPYQNFAGAAFYVGNGEPGGGYVAGTYTNNTGTTQVVGINAHISPQNASAQFISTEGSSYLIA